MTVPNLYSQTLLYSSFRTSSFPFFIRAAQHKNYAKLAIITGIASADDLRSQAKEGHKRVGAENWHDFHLSGNFWLSMNMDKLDTLK